MVDNYSKTKEAIDKISALGYRVEKTNDNLLYFIFKNKRILYYPKKEWATGGSIKDCRGLGALLKQITSDSKTITVKTITDKLAEQIADATERYQNATTKEDELTFNASADAFQFILDFINEEQ